MAPKSSPERFCLDKIRSKSLGSQVEAPKQVRAARGGSGMANKI